MTTLFTRLLDQWLHGSLGLQFILVIAAFLALLILIVLLEGPFREHRRQMVRGRKPPRD